MGRAVIYGTWVGLLYMICVGLLIWRFYRR